MPGPGHVLGGGYPARPQWIHPPPYYATVIAPTFPASDDLAEGTGTRAHGAVTTLANDWLVVEVEVENGATGSTMVPTASGLTFTLQNDISGSPNTDHARILQYTAPDTTGASRTVTITPNAGTLRYRSRVTVVRGSNGPGTGKGTSSTTQTVSVTRQGDHSAMFMDVVDWSVGAVGSPSWTPGGTTVVSQQGAGGTYLFGRWADSGAAATASHGISSPSYTTPSIAVLEMLGAPAGPAQSIVCTGIGSAESLGKVTATPGSVTITQTGVASEAAVGEPSVAFPSATIAFDSSGNTTFASVTTTNIDITSAAVGATCYALLALGVNQAGNVTWTGWTQVLEGDEGTATHYAFYKRVKQVGDTTMAVSWGTATRGTIVWSSYTNVASDEGAAATLHTVSSATYPTPSVTPGGTGRWAISPTWSRSTTTANQTQSYTADAALLERQDANNGANPWVPSTIADSNAIVTVAAHTYTATMTTTGASALESHGGAILAYLVPAAGGATQTLNASGIASEEREGSSVALPGSVTIAQTGIASEEREGSSVTASAITITQTGIASEEREGSSLTSSAATISAVGVTSGERFGSNSINLSVTASSIFGAEAAGNSSASNVNSISSAGISTSERVGAVSVTSSATILASSIPSQEVVGNASALLAQTLQATGIDSQTSVGSPALTVGAATISAAGVATSERVGVAQVTTTVSVTPTGIASSEVSGSSSVFITQTISAFGISSNEKFGTTRIDQTVNPSSVQSAESFGSGTANQTVAPSGIYSESYNVGNPTVLLAQTVSATGVPSAEQLGSVALVPGPTTVTASGIASAERTGSSSAATTSTVTATGISSSEASGNPNLQIAQSVLAHGIASASELGHLASVPGPVTVSATGVASAEIFGTSSSASASIISANSISSVEAFGNPSFSTIVAINGHGIVSAGNVGGPTITATITVQAHGVSTAQLLGSPNLGMLITASGIASAQAVSKLSITVGATTISCYGISTQERFGRVVVTAIPIVAPAPDTTIELQLGRTTIKIQTVGSTLQLDDAITKIKMKNNQTIVMLESGTIIELEGSIFG